MSAVLKVTANLPADLLRKARRATGLGITETLRLGLELVAAAPVYDEVLALRGKVRLGISVRALRADRR